MSIYVALLDDTVGETTEAVILDDDNRGAAINGIVYAIFLATDATRFGIDDAEQILSFRGIAKSVQLTFRLLC